MKFATVEVVLLLILLTTTCIKNGICAPSGDEWQIRSVLYQLLEETLLNDSLNHFKLQRIFFHLNGTHRSIAPLFIRVNYNITCTQSGDCDNDSEQMNCTAIMPSFLWTSLPFHRLSIITLSLLSTQSGFEYHGISGFEDDTTLPFLHLNLHIYGIPCGVSTEIFYSELYGLTTKVNSACATYNIMHCCEQIGPIVVAFLLMYI